MNKDKLIEAIVQMIFDEEVDLNEPSETVEQVRAKLYAEGMYTYKKACTACGGSGRYKSGKCSSCSGTGKEI